MPVRYDRDDYSFQLGDHGARDYARLRRFGNENPEDSRTMSLVSSPLQVPLVGQRRSVSPSYRNSPTPQHLVQDNEDDYDEEIKNIQRHSRRPSNERRRYDYRNYEDYEYEPLEPLVPTYQPRYGRSSQRSNAQRNYPSPSRYQPRRQMRPQPVEQFEDYSDEEDIPRYQQRRPRQQELVEEDERSQTPPRQQQQQRSQKQEEIDLDDLYKWKRKSNKEHGAPSDIGYAVPPIRKRTDPQLQTQDENIRSVAGYIAKRKQFAVEDEDEMHYYKNPNYQYRVLTGDLPVISDRDVEESIDRSKLDRAPMFDMKLRSHQVWEKMNVKFTCTVRGHPLPRVTWYKDMVPLEPSLHDPGKYRIKNNFGLHTLEICRATTDDSGTYRVSLQNRKGEISSYATLLVRRYDGGKSGFVDMKSGYNLKKPTDYPNVEGMNVPDKEAKPHTSAIEVNEYDELPDTDAGKYFKSQLENLDFDVNKLIKEAKLEKEIAAADDASKTPPKPTVRFSDDVTIVPHKSTDLDIDVGKAPSAGTETDKSDVTTNNVTSSSDDTEHHLATKQDRFKVAIEVKVTNEGRRDSLDVFEKVIQAEPTVNEA